MSAPALNQKPETRNQKKTARANDDCFWFLVSGFWFLISPAVKPETRRKPPGQTTIASGFWFLVSSFSFRRLVAVVVEHRVDDGHDLLAFGQAERLLPQPGLVVADDEEVRVVVPCRRVLPDLLQRGIDLSPRPGEEVPAGPGVHSAGVGLQLRRRVVGGIDRDGDEHQILAETVGVALLHRRYRSGEDGTARRTRGEERVQDDAPSVEERIEIDGLAVLIDEVKAGEVLRRGRRRLRLGGQQRKGQQHAGEKDARLHGAFDATTSRRMRASLAGSVSPSRRCHRPLRSSMMTISGACEAGSAGDAPSDRVSVSMSGFGPVTSVHPRWPPILRAHAARRSGVSVAGSMLTEMSETSLLGRFAPPSSRWSCAKRAPINGQTVVQLVKMKLMATTRPFTRSE